MARSRRHRHEATIRYLHRRTDHRYVDCRRRSRTRVARLPQVRAFRVFRLFKRVESLRKIVEALEGAIPGVSHACVILLLVMSIYAILGVTFFGEAAPEHFGTFGASLLTNCQVGRRVEAFFR
jgi:hypothetical protein